jgi:hypothetical protein
MPRNAGSGRGAEPLPRGGRDVVELHLYYEIASRPKGKPSQEGLGLKLSTRYQVLGTA